MTMRPRETGVVPSKRSLYPVEPALGPKTHEGLSAIAYFDAIDETCTFALQAAQVTVDLARFLGSLIAHPALREAALGNKGIKSAQAPAAPTGETGARHILGASGCRPRVFSS